MAFHKLPDGDHLGWRCTATQQLQPDLAIRAVANEELPTFIDGLLVLKFRSASGELVHLDGRVRSRGSADPFVTLLYSLTGDVAHLYDVSFDWRHYRRAGRRASAKGARSAGRRPVSANCARR